MENDTSLILTPNLLEKAQKITLQIDEQMKLKLTEPLV